LSGVSSATADVSATVAISAQPTGGTAYAGVVGRRIGGDDYSALLSLASTGAVRVSLMHGGTNLSSAAVSGLTYTVGTELRLRMQVSGSGTTTLHARVWKAGDAEPATWQVTTTDTTAGLQGPGSVGLRSYLGSGVTSGRTTFSFGDLTAQTVGAPTPNNAPTASFTAATSGLTVSADGSGSSDSDGSVKAWAWDFGDGATGSGATASHTYADGGSYPVTLTVTDDQGAKDTTSKQVSVSAPATTHLAQDAFGRTVTGGLGTADVGGAWTTAGTSSNFSVGSGSAAFRTPSGSTLSGYLGSVSSTDTDVSVAITVPARPSGGSLYATVVGRRVGSADYSTSVVVSSTGAVSLSLVRSGTNLRSAAVSGVTASAGSVLHVRMRTTGNGTTTLQARAWLDGAAQPSSWQATATDTTAALQAAGSVGLRSYVSAAVTNGPLVVRFDDFTADPAA
ncbi:MAG: hypothetical protein QOC59_1256, partial [Microbacteriaceae bacterium]|nr:hypothetical protein [Microbacteriaceae bacterium]